MKGAVLLLVLTAVAYIGGLFFLSLAVVFLPFFPVIYRRMNDFTVSLWLRLVPVSLQLLSYSHRCMPSKLCVCKKNDH